MRRACDTLSVFKCCLFDQLIAIRYTIAFKDDNIVIYYIICAGIYNLINIITYYSIAFEINKTIIKCSIVIILRHDLI